MWNAKIAKTRRKTSDIACYKASACDVVSSLASASAFLSGPLWPSVVKCLCASCLPALPHLALQVLDQPADTRHPLGLQLTGRDQHTRPLDRRHRTLRDLIEQAELGTQ